MIDLKARKQQNEKLLQYGRENARPIKESFPYVESVEVLAYVSDTSNDLCYTSEKTLLPDDLLYLYYPCINNNCDGIGYNLTDILTDCLKNRKTIDIEETTEKECSGNYYDNEDQCYYKCSGRIVYSIEPKFK